MKGCLTSWDIVPGQLANTSSYTCFMGYTAFIFRVMQSKKSGESWLPWFKYYLICGCTIEQSLSGCAVTALMLTVQVSACLTVNMKALSSFRTSPLCSPCHVAQLPSELEPSTTQQHYSDDLIFCISCLLVGLLWCHSFRTFLVFHRAHSCCVQSGHCFFTFEQPPWASVEHNWCVLYLFRKIQLHTWAISKPSSDYAVNWKVVHNVD
jgi:hypothetical protein